MKKINTQLVSHTKIIYNKFHLNSLVNLIIFKTIFLLFSTSIGNIKSCQWCSLIVQYQPLRHSIDKRAINRSEPGYQHCPEAQYIGPPVQDFCCRGGGGNRARRTCTTSYGSFPVVFRGQ